MEKVTVETVLDFELFRSAVYHALKSWARIDSGEEELLGSLLLVQRARETAAQEGGPISLRQITNNVLEQALATLAGSDKRAEALLRARFIEGETTRKVAVGLEASVDQVNRWQRQAIDDLAGILHASEMALRSARMDRLEAMLPAPTYTQLFGFEEAHREACDALLSPGDPWTVTISGIGGIGKTSLAQSVTRRVIQDLTFASVYWLRAAAQEDGSAPDAAHTYHRLLQSLSEALWPGNGGPDTASARETKIRNALRAQPILVVIDNLEDEETTAYILERIHALAEPSKFLLTTRSNPTISAATYVISLSELPEDQADALVREHAGSIGLTALTQANPATIAGIYDVTGGNPLALKLVSSLAAVLPIPRVLEDLQQLRSGPVEDLYRHIYWQSWRTLSEQGRALLLAMPLVAESGGLPSHIQAMSGLAEADFWPAVTELVTRCLLEVQGNLQERRYGIHRLTETFLRTEIIDWPV